MTGSVAEELAAALWRRVRDVVLVSERIDGFVFGPEGSESRPAVAPGEEEAAARQFVLRALAALGDPAAWRILDAARGEDGATFVALAEALGMPRIVVAERVDDLVRAGLAVRSLEAEAVHASAAGLALATLVDQTAVALGATIAEARTRKDRNNGLPVL